VSILLVLTVGYVSTAGATDYTWASTAKLTWSDPTTWTQGSGYPATIADTANFSVLNHGNVTVTLDVSATVQAVTAGDASGANSLTIATGTLTVGDGTTPGSITMADPDNNGGAFTFTGPVVIGAAGVTVTNKAPVPTGYDATRWLGLNGSPLSGGVITIAQGVVNAYHANTHAGWIVKSGAAILIDGDSAQNIGTTTGITLDGGILGVTGSKAADNIGKSSNAVPLIVTAAGGTIDLTVGPGQGADGCTVSLNGGDGLLQGSGPLTIVFRPSSNYTAYVDLKAGNTAFSGNITTSLEGAPGAITPELRVGAGGLGSGSNQCSLATGTKLTLNGSNTVASLILNGVEQTQGFTTTYGSTSSSAENKDNTWFGGTNVLTVIGKPQGPIFLMY
jgi:hypothetical protein